MRGFKPTFMCFNLNINHGHNKALMEKCRTLAEYEQFVAVSREYAAEGRPMQEALEEGYASGLQEGRASAILTILEQWLLTAFQNDFGSYASFLIGKQYSIFEYI